MTIFLGFRRYLMSSLPVASMAPDIGTALCGSVLSAVAHILACDGVHRSERK
jgi:hypothetical protein